MNPAFWGLMAALAWGGADFIARFTGRAMGHHVALFAMLAVGTVTLSLIVWLTGIPLVWDWSGWWLLAATGIGVMTATLLLYWALARGPVSVAAPIAGSFPALNLVLAVALGARPGWIQWAAMAVVLGGVVVVARSAASFAAGGEFTHAHLRRTVVISLAAALGFAVTVAAAQGAAEIYGALQTVWLGRWISLLSAAVVLAWVRKPPVAPVRWWPLIGLQGVLDGVAYLALLAGSEGVRSAIAVVVASAFSAVTVLLARFIIKEAMTKPQWAGIGLILAGAATLSAFR